MVRCFDECGIEYPLKRPSIMKPKDYSQMFDSSPVKNIDRVKTPTLLMLGQEDKRVPHYDGLNWWYYLKGKGDVDIRCKVYNEIGHSLDNIDAEVFGFIAIIKFLNEKVVELNH